MTTPGQHFPTEDCRGCGAPIIWARTVNGRPMPVDKDTRAGGNVRLSWEGSDVRAYVVKATLTFGATNLRTSHFVTCPKADEWRRKNGRSFDPAAANRRIRGPR